MHKLLTSITGFMFIAGLLNAQQIIPLYDNGIPNAKPCDAIQHEFIDSTWNRNGLLIVNNIIKPALALYTPAVEKSNGTAVLICPGGGYGVVAAGHEGADVAKAFNDIGITAFVLYYRLPNDACMTNKAFVPLMDAQQAMYIIRKNAKQYGISENKVGIIGFSAGGHLAASASVHFNDAVRKELAGFNLRPDFSILVYPVISFSDSIGHIGSRDNLIGKNPDKKMIHYFSNEEMVTSKTPPAFLVHASDDDGVKPDNSILYYQALLKKNVSAEMHLYQHGGHGFGLNNTSTTDQWFQRCANWLKVGGWL